MNPIREQADLLTRRYFFGRTAAGIGTVALASLLNDRLLGAATAEPVVAGILGRPHIPATAKRVFYLSMNGAPSQLETFDYKPKLNELFDADLPDSVRMGQRITTMTSGQTRLPIAPSVFKFGRHGQGGAWVSELLPHLAKVVDDLAIVRTVNTDAINHDPACTFVFTGAQRPGLPSMGAWVSYGLGSLNENLPTFVVLHSTWSSKRDAQAVFSRLWGSGFLPSKYQGVALRTSGDPVLYLSNPPGVDSASRRRMLDALAELNQKELAAVGDPEINTRIAQYEMAYRMQTSVPELTDMSNEPKHVLDLYGPDVHIPGTVASNCLLARRLAERNVRFIQIFQRGWDHHGNLPTDMRLQCRDIDQPCAALVKDLKQRGMLDDTLVIWGGEFGRTVYCKGKLTREDYGRDNHPRRFTMWMAGGGVKPGIVYGETDDFSYNIVRDPVHVHDLNATILHCLGVNHERLTYRFQGRDFRLTDVHGNVARGLLA